MAGGTLPKYLGRFTYGDLRPYTDAAGDVQDALAALSNEMAGAFPDTSRTEPEIEVLIEKLNLLNDDVTMLTTAVLGLIEKARNR